MSNMYKNFLSTGPGIGLTTVVGICAILGLVAFILRFTDKKEGYENQESKKFDNIYQNFFGKIQALDNMVDNNKLNYNLSGIKVFILNMPRSTSRRQYMEEQMVKYDIDVPIEFIEGVDGKKFSRKTKQHFDYEFLNGKKITIYTKDPFFFTDGELGCLMSHIEAIFTAYHQNLQNILIIEDDTYMGLLGIADKTLQDVINETPEDWEYISLFKSCSKKFKKTARTISKNCWGSVGYILNRKGMEKILKLIKRGDSYSFIFNESSEVYKKLLEFHKKHSEGKYSVITSDIILPIILNSYTYHTPLVIPNNTDLAGTRGSSENPTVSNHDIRHIKIAINNIDDFLSKQ